MNILKKEMKVINLIKFGERLQVENAKAVELEEEVANVAQEEADAPEARKHADVPRTESI